ncbi:MAG: hypothetical protein NTW49_05460 [Bacteroidia bacterium]|nr:hypothetical protein [Bacteroidia bacterium]
MKYLKFIILIFIFGCNGDIYFSEPQPSFASNLKEFPKSITGFYFSVNDSGYLQITTKHIIEYTPVKINEDSVKSDTIEKSRHNKYVLQMIDGKKIICAVDTELHLDTDVIARKSGKTIYINSGFHHYLWQVYRLKILSIDSIETGTIDPKKELKDFKSITSVKMITGQNLKEILANDSSDKYRLISVNDSLLSNNDTIFILKPTKREFRKINKGKFFTNKEKFIKVLPPGKILKLK